MILNDYWKIQEKEKELLKEIEKWRYRVKHFDKNKKFLSDKDLDIYIKTGYFNATFTAIDILNEYKEKLKVLKTKEYKSVKRFLKKKRRKNGTV